LTTNFYSSRRTAARWHTCSVRPRSSAPATSPYTSPTASEARANISRIKAALREGGVQVEDGPNDVLPAVRLGIAGLVIALIAGIVAAAYFAAVFPDWTGFGPPLLDAQGQEIPHAKTLWDWLGRLLIPLVLAIGGFFLTRSENRYALSLQERREAEARRLEAERAQDAALQAYLDQMTQLLLHEELRTSQPDDEVRSVARARTLTVLRVLDGVRRATVLQFLYEVRLIGGIKREGIVVVGTFDAIVSLGGANLSKADLTNCNVTREQLAQALSLEGAKLPFDIAPPAPEVEVAAQKDQVPKKERVVEP